MIMLKFIKDRALQDNFVILSPEPCEGTEESQSFATPPVSASRNVYLKLEVKYGRYY